MGLDIISSVSSTKVEKIIINRGLRYLNRPVNDAFWTELDDILIKFVERPGYKCILEVELREFDVKGFDQKGPPLPMFAEKGRITARNR